MKGTGIGVVGGIAVTLLVHGALAGGYAAYRASESERIDADLKSPPGFAKKEPPLLCADNHRCKKLEIREKRREPEPSPVSTPDVLDATMIPALGNVAPDPTKLPEIQTVERPEVYEEAVNLDKSPSQLNKIIKGPEHLDPLLDPKEKKDKLRDLMTDEPLDPRARAKDLSRLTGFKEGEVGGAGQEIRLGSIYSTNASKAIRKFFTLPPFFDEASLKKLQVKILVKKMRLDGAIEEFEVKSRSGDRSFDDAAIAAVKKFVPDEGGDKTLPPPDPEVLRYINQKGLLIQFDGRVIKLQ